MTKIDIEQIKADREAGTQGEWIVEDGDVWDIRFDGEPGVPMFRPVRDYRGWGREYTAVQQSLDARRIARVPDLEAALIEAIELLRYMQKQMLPRGNQKIENFLERFK